jgi:hypothetical protein
MRVNIASKRRLGQDSSEELFLLVCNGFVRSGIPPLFVKCSARAWRCEGRVSGGEGVGASVDSASDKRFKVCLDGPGREAGWLGACVCVSQELGQLKLHMR